MAVGFVDVDLIVSQEATEAFSKVKMRTTDSGLRCYGISTVNVACSAYHGKLNVK